MHAILTTVLAVTLPAALTAGAALQVVAGEFSQPRTVAAIDLDKLKGKHVSRLAWSPDGTLLYVQTMDGEFPVMPGVKLFHYTFATQDGARKDLKEEPDWAAAYWVEKSGQVSPDGGPLKIELKSETRAQKTVSTPMGGDLARGGTVGDATGSSTGDALSAAYNQQAVPVHTMLLLGEPIAEYVNSVIVPGQTFGWGPKGSRVVAFANVKSGRVVIMDDAGSKSEIAGSKDAILPGWSPDGKALAWLQKDGKKKYVLQVARIGST